MFQSFSQEYDKKVDPNVIDDYNELTNKNNLSNEEEAKKNQMLNLISENIKKAMRFGKYKQDTNNQCDVIDLLEKAMKNLHRKINEHNLASLNASDQAILKAKIDDFKQYLTNLEGYLDNEEKVDVNN